jgi:site-specific DNA recombinase
MIAAIYARKSTDQNVADEAKSVTRQIEHARAYAASKGWVIADHYVYVDDGISGAEFAKRPGFVRLMTALTPRPPFQVLVMSEESRLGREAIETAYALKQLISAGVRVFFYLEDRERTLDSPIEKVMLSIQTMADEMEREKSRQRMVDTMTRKAKAGHVTGGKCFGYENVEVYGDGLDAHGRRQRSHVEQRINEGEAAVIRRIFELAASGHGQSAIAKILNAENALAPSSQRGRPRSWVQSSVHEALFRPRYRGELVWNTTKKRDQWGQRRGAKRQESDWIRIPAPHLRIVSDELWAAAHARIDATRKVFVSGGPRHTRKSRYLLPGLARCAWCNGGLHVRTKTRAHGRQVRTYACSSHYNRGASVCENQIQVPMEMTDEKVIRAIGNILRPELLEIVILGVKADVEQTATSDPRAPILTAIEAIDGQIANVTDAIAMGGTLGALVARLQTLEERRLRLLSELEAVPAPPPLPRIDWAATERRARRLLGDWRGLLAKNAEDARPVLKDLLDGEPISFTPVDDATLRGFRFKGAATIGGLLEGIVGVGSLVSPGGPVGSYPRWRVEFDDDIGVALTA